MKENAKIQNAPSTLKPRINSNSRVLRSQRVMKKEDTTESKNNFRGVPMKKISLPKTSPTR